MAIQSFRPTVGGAELQLERLLPHLAARGVSVTVLTRAHRDAPRLELLDGGELRRTRVGGTSPLASLAFVIGSLSYRDVAISGTANLYHDGYAVARTRAAAEAAAFRP